MRAHGIKLVISADQLYDPNEPFPAPDADPLLALVKAAGRDLIYGVYSYDEPASRGISVAASKALYEHVKAIDPSLPVVQINASIDETDPAMQTADGIAAYLASVAAHAQWADIVGFDVYPIGLNSGAVSPFSNGAMVSPAQAVADYMQWLRENFPDSQHAMVLQAFDPRDLYSDEMLASISPEALAALAPPTAQQLSEMLAATNGADAVFWWGQSHITDSTTSTLWQDVLATTRSYVDTHGSATTNVIAGTVLDDGLFGTGVADRINGEAGNDSLTGGDGNDILVGGAGADTMDGGAGNDTYYVDDLGDRVSEAAGNGYDVVRTALASFSLASANMSGEIEMLVGTSGSGQRLTGNALDNVIFGSWGNDILNGNGGADILRGGSGNDTYIVKDARVLVDEGGSSGTDTIATNLATFDLRTAKISGTIENLTGTASTGQVLTGNANANVITGGIGNDTLAGGGGYDTLRGGAGNDVYIITGTELADETGSSGIDEIRTSLSGLDLAGPHVAGAIENLTGTAATGQMLMGNALANVITAGAGSDFIDGRRGADTMRGGRGNDTYVVDNVGDLVQELAGGGTDTVTSTVTYTLPDYVENLQLSGSANINATGNGAANVIWGNAGANRIDGGAGADVMAGGAGNDTYIVDNAGDVVVDEGPGTDTVHSSVTFALGQNLENLQLTGTAAIGGFGNELANRITGNAAANHIDGGAGADTMSGGGGDDIYIVDNAGDRIIEASGQGNDLVVTSVSFVLGAGVEVERIVMSDPYSTKALTLRGNAFANSLQGNAGANTLDGGGGGDTLAGGAGNDIYVVRNSADQVIEIAGGGTDTVRAVVNYTLAAATEVEVLSAADPAATTSLVLTGNDFNNRITGNAGNNQLTGGGGQDKLTGGLGQDKLTGGTGADVFVFTSVSDSAAGATSRDFISDFSHAERDRIDLSAIDANTALAGDQAFSFLGTGAFTHKAGELRQTTVSGGELLEGDVNGDGRADFQILLKAGLVIQTSDFIL